jgi:hypothetical protein
MEIEGIKIEPSYYPSVPWEFTDEHISRALRSLDGKIALLEAYDLREELIRLAKSDPYGHEPMLDHWHDAEKLLEGSWRSSDAVIDDKVLKTLFLIILGGNRSGKSRYAGWKTVRSAIEFPGSNIICLAENEKTSIETQQAIIWHYLPNEDKALNNKQGRSRDGQSGYYIKYESYCGFGKERLVALRNGSKIHFKTYNQDPGDCEGWMFGVAGKVAVGVWADENLRVNWLAMLLRRLRFQQAHLLWSFTPINGMTPTIKEAVGDGGRVLESRPAELLPDRVNVPGLPVGHMPYVQEAALNRGKVIYFWSSMNPFGDGDRSYYEGVKEDCQGRSSEYTQRIAYGYTRETVGKPFPLFGPWNVMEPEHIPKQGSNFQFVDPAGGRSWANLWVRVTADGKHYIYRDWPDEQTYGEWALPNIESTGDNLAKLHKAGPAQNSQGLGTSALRQLWRGLEGDEEIAERYIDPRAGRNPHAADHGGTCLIEDLAADYVGPDGVVVEGMDFIPASGVAMEEGLTQVNELLHWDERRALDMVTNAPRLFVSRECTQVIGALNHWPGPAAGEKHPWKDFADLLRYMAVADLGNALYALDSEDVCYV